MSQIAAPFGLQPAYSPSGIVRPGPLGTIVSAHPTTIYQGEPVAINAGGFLIGAAAGVVAIGTFQGVEWDDVEGRHRVSNRWIANTVATNIRAYYIQAQDSVMYQIQANAALTQASLGQQYDWTALAGSDITGLSSVSLDVASAAANAGLRVLGLNPGPDNDITDPFPIVLVQISQHQTTADVASI